MPEDSAGSSGNVGERFFPYAEAMMVKFAMSRATAYRRRINGEIETVVDGSRRLVSESELKRYAELRKRKD